MPRDGHTGAEAAAGTSPVLLIEDDGEIAELIAVILQDLGFTATHATDG